MARKYAPFSSLSKHRGQSSGRCVLVTFADELIAICQSALRCRQEFMEHHSYSPSSGMGRPCSQTGYRCNPTLVHEWSHSDSMASSLCRAAGLHPDRVCCEFSGRGAFRGGASGYHSGRPHERDVGGMSFWPCLDAPEDQEQWSKIVQYFGVHNL